MAMGRFTEQGCQGELGNYTPAHSEGLGAARQYLSWNGERLLGLELTIWKSLASENYSGRDSKLFGPGFVEKSSKFLKV